MSQDIEDTSNPHWVRGGFGLGPCRSAGWLVVPGRIDGELADQLAGGGVDDADVQAVDEHESAEPVLHRLLELPGLALDPIHVMQY
jgi:hypothetical protein